MRAHRDAVIAELESRLPGSVFSSYGAVDLPRYAVVFIALSSKPRTRYTGSQFRDIYTVTIHSVGKTEEHASAVLERVNQLTGKVLTVPGRKLWPVEYVTGQSVDLDDDGPVPLRWFVSQFDITSDPL